MKRACVAEKPNRSKLVLGGGCLTSGGRQGRAGRYHDVARTMTPEIRAGIAVPANQPARTGVGLR
jgi:hypothetical protein